MRLRSRVKQLRHMTVVDLEERRRHVVEWIAWASLEVKSRELRQEYRERLRTKLVKARQELRQVECQIAREQK